MGKHKGKKKNESAGQQQQPAKQGQKKAKEEPKDPSGYAQAMAIPELEEEMDGLELDESGDESEQTEKRGRDAKASSQTEKVCFTNITYYS